MARLRLFLSSTALLGSLSTAALPAAAQDAYAVSGDQFGYGHKAVASANFQATLFGGGNEGGGTYGGTSSFAMPLGDNMGLQVDGVAGYAADEYGFFGGAAQLFYRDPEAMALGVMGGAYAFEGNSQYALSAFAEFYIDNLTLEATAGYQDGDVVESSAYGRVGAAVYATPNLRLGAGVSYSEKTEWGGDLQVEALLSDAPGLALFALATFDEEGTGGYGGIRFYFGAADSLAAADRTKQAGGPTLMSIQRNLSRPNMFMADPVGFGIHQISRAAAAASGGKSYGDVKPNDGDNNTGGDTPTDETNQGLVDLVNNTLAQLGDNTAIQPLTDLLNALTDPNGDLSAITGALNDLTALDGGPLAPLTELVGALAGTNNAALNPLVDTLNGILGGLASGADPTGITNGLSSLPGLDSLTGLFGGTPLDASQGQGLIDVVNGVLSDLGDNSAIQPLTDLLNALTNANDGALSPITSALNELTALDGGALGPVTDLVQGLVATDNQALEPLISTLNSILGGLGAGADTSAITSGLSLLPGSDLLSGLFGSDVLSGGSTTAGLIDTVNGVLSGLGDGSVIQPLTDLLTTLTSTDPNAPLSALTNPLNDLTAIDGGALGPLTELVNGLVGADVGALDPLIDTLNTILGGFGDGLDTTQISDTVASLPIIGDLAGLFGF